MNRDDRATVRKAARSLREEAKLTFESCTVGDKAWACGDCRKFGDKCSAQRRHDDLLVTAKKLMTMAGKNQRGKA